MGLPSPVCSDDVVVTAGQAVRCFPLGQTCAPNLALGIGHRIGSVLERAQDTQPSAFQAARGSSSTSPVSPASPVSWGLVHVCATTATKTSQLPLCRPTGHLPREGRPLHVKPPAPQGHFLPVVCPPLESRPTSARLWSDSLTSLLPAQCGH